MIQEQIFSGVHVEVRHEVVHGLAVDIVVTRDSAHVSGEDTLCLNVVSDQLQSVQLLDALGHLIQENHVSRRVLLELSPSVAVSDRVLFDSLVEERLLQPLDAFSHGGDSTRSDLGIDTVVKSLD